MDEITVKSCDVLIVGGGPGGISTAFTLGKNGIKTILIDRKPRERIGDKVCGDALSPYYTNRTYEWVGLPKPNPKNGELNEVCDKSVLVGINIKNRINIGIPSATVDRLKYGQALLNEVEQYKAVEILAETRVLEVITQNTSLLGIVASNPTLGKIQIKAKITIDASGSSGVVRSRLPKTMTTKFPRKIPKHEMIVAYREIIELPEEHPYQKGIYLLYEPEIADLMPGYYWAFSKGKKQLNIGLGWMMYPKNVGKNINKVNQAIRERKFPNAKVFASQGDQIPARLPLPSLVHNGFMTVGDAGALASPLSGEGHGSALLSGIKAAEIAMGGLNSNDFSEKGLWEYNRWIWHEFGVEFSVGISVIKFINKHGMKTLDWLMEKGILQEDDIINMVDDAGADMKIVRRALKGWYRPRVLLGLKKTVDHIDELQEHARSYPDPENFAPWLAKLEQYVAKTF